MTSLQQRGHKQTAEAYIEWLNTARPSQVTPQGDDWNIWLILAGRGWGKTRTGAADAILYALRNPESQVAVITPTFGDLKRTAFEGPSGILKTLPKECLFKGRGHGYNSSGASIRLYNGSQIMGFSATEPDRLRGPQFHRAWCDELAAWRYPEAFDQLMFALRLGENPKCVITTTPRPTPLIRQLLARKDAIVTTGNTFENSDNLAESTLHMLKEKYEGTALGRQELYAEVIDQMEGALWKPSQIEEMRLDPNEEIDLTKIIVAIDPAVTNNSDSDETGIVVCGLGLDDRYYILDDVSGKMTPDAWAKTAVNAYHKHKASRIIAEVNNGGDLVERLLRTVDKNIPYKAVTATKGKVIRAEPISALYEQKRVSHCGIFSKLEDQMCSFTGEKSNSPDRLDALVWALTELSKSSMTALWRVT